MPVELLTLEVGLDLLPLVDAARKGELLGRIASLRKQMALELGFIVPPIHVRDDLRLRPGCYRILVSGVKVAAGELRVGRLLAIDPAGRAASRPVPGERSASRPSGCRRAGSRRPIAPAPRPPAARSSIRPPVVRDRT